MGNSEWKPWVESDVWKTKAAFFAWLRGQMRRSIWSHYPPKNEFKQSKLRPANKKDYDRGISKRTKKVGECVHCGEWFPASKLQVDHLSPAGSLRNTEDILPFVQGLACLKENMALVCKPCHDVKTLADRRGISFGEAVVASKVNKKMKETKASQDKQLKALGLPHGNDEKRKTSWTKHLGN